MLSAHQKFCPQKGFYGQEMRWTSFILVSKQLHVYVHLWIEGTRLTYFGYVLKPPSLNQRSFVKKVLHYCLVALYISLGFYR